MKITQAAYQLASQCETLEELGTRNPGWNLASLRDKVGIEKRYCSTNEETALTLATQAAKKLIGRIDPQEIEGLVYVTQSPDSLIPSTACILHENLGLSKNAMAFDLNQGCSGFVYGLSVASSFLKSGYIKNCLIVCSETYSKYIEDNDRTCKPIFSDGASAILVEDGVNGNIGPFVFKTDGSGAPNLALVPKIENGSSDHKVLRMNGPKVFFFTMGAVSDAIQNLLDKAHLKLNEIDSVIVHQASKVVLDNIQRKLRIGDDKFIRNMEDKGNTVSATIPIAYQQAVEQGKIKPGMNVLLMGFGVGYSLAGCLIRT